MILGTIGSYSSGTGVTVTIDGETDPTTKQYMFLSSYTPHVGDRVLIEEISGTYVVMGAVTTTPVPISHAATADSATTATAADYVGNQGSFSTNMRIRFRISSGKLQYLFGSWGWQTVKNE